MDLLDGVTCHLLSTWQWWWWGWTSYSVSILPIHFEPCNIFQNIVHKWRHQGRCWALSGRRAQTSNLPRKEWQLQYMLLFWQQAMQLSQWDRRRAQWHLVTFSVILNRGQSHRLGISFHRFSKKPCKNQILWCQYYAFRDFKLTRFTHLIVYLNSKSYI